jgi:hypothetical protein
MLDAGRGFTDRVWAVEGCGGIGKHIAHRLVHDGETVFDVPSKLSAQVRVFATGNGRKTNPVDAHSVAMVALRRRFRKTRLLQQLLRRRCSSVPLGVPVH